MNLADELIADLLWILEGDFSDFEEDYLKRLCLIRKLIDEVFEIHQPPQKIELDQNAWFNFFVTQIQKRMLEQRN